MAQEHPLNDICLDFDPLVAAELIERENQFRTRILVEGRESTAFLADRGRLEKMMVPGRKLWVRPAPAGPRKTAYDLVLIEYEGHIVSLNTHLPNRLLRRALLGRALPWFSDYTTVQSEVRFGESRLDFRLTNEQDQACWVEVKSAALVEAGVARFPDAPTLRGRRHLGELVTAVRQGDRAAVLFLVQRSDAMAFTTKDETDPEFGRVLRAAVADGVEVRALRCTVTTSRICLDSPIPVVLGGGFDTPPAR